MNRIGPDPHAKQAARGTKAISRVTEIHALKRETLMPSWILPRNTEVKTPTHTRGFPSLEGGQAQSADRSMGDSTPWGSPGASRQCPLPLEPSISTPGGKVFWGHHGRPGRLCGSGTERQGREALSSLHFLPCWRHSECVGSNAGGGWRGASAFLTSLCW